MKKFLVASFLIIQFSICNLQSANAQCSICTKTASQLGEKPARGLNAGILYLMFTPLAIAGYVGFRWWKREKEFTKLEEK